MTTLALTGIGELTTHDPEQPVLHDAALVVEHGRVAWAGPAAQAPAATSAPPTITRRANGFAIRLSIILYPARFVE